MSTESHAKGQQGGTTLAIELVKLAGQTWITAQNFDSLLDRFGVKEPEQQIQFLTGVKGALNALPVKIFADAEARAKLLDAAQDALDAAIAKEEEEE